MPTTAANSNCLHDEAACWCVPSEFVRPRFFFGQRLGVVDFSDWLWYHGGKQRFHNLNLHGVGVVCGLRAERYLPPQEDQTTLLRVTSGAAYDACGREVVVGVDQCIDVAAWYLQNRDRPEIRRWRESEDHKLCVGLRYRECPSDPAPAPRDPCGCDAGGCEYARVREGFELRLFTHAEMEAMSKTPACDSRNALKRAIEQIRPESIGGDDCAALWRLLRTVAPIKCPPPASGDWLWLACFDVTLDEEYGRVLAIHTVDNDIAQRLVLLSTATLQELLINITRDAALEGRLGPGPRISGFEFEGTDTDSGNVKLFVTPYDDPSSGEPSQLVPGSLHINLRRLDPVNGWENLDPSDDHVQYVDGAMPHILVEWSSGLSEGIYRFTLASPSEEPVVDTNARPLRPMSYSRRFQLTVRDDKLTIDPGF